MIDLKQLERDRERGTPGPWRIVEDMEVFGPELTDHENTRVADWLSPYDARRIARLPDLEAEYIALRKERACPKVKPLVWEAGGADAFTHDADFVDTTQTYQIQDGIFWYAAEATGVNCGSNEAAKAAAQRDYERRILEALE